jgi:hypothetical protein
MRNTFSPDDKEYKEFYSECLGVFLNYNIDKIEQEINSGLWDESLIDLLKEEVKRYNRINIIEIITKRCGICRSG